MRFVDAWERGNSDTTFRKLRGKAIHIRPLRRSREIPAPGCYEHIPGAQHEDDWENDVKGNRDVFLVGEVGSWVASDDGPEVTQELVEALRFGIDWKGNATVKNPLTENARGKHVCLTGSIAQKVILMMPDLPTTTVKAESTGCQRKCSCY